MGLQRRRANKLVVEREAQQGRDLDGREAVGTALGKKAASALSSAVLFCSVIATWWVLQYFLSYSHHHHPGPGGSKR